MSFSRRRLIAVTPAAVVTAVLTAGAVFGATTSDLAVTCDAAVAPAVSAAGAAYQAKTGVRACGKIIESTTL